MHPMSTWSLHLFALQQLPVLTLNVQAYSPDLGP